VIVYDLRCRKNHRFEGWFQDISSFEEQRIKKIITCPICGDLDIEMIPTSFIKRGKDMHGSAVENAAEISPRQALQLFHDYLNKHFDDVGDRFAEIAVKMNEGDEEKRNIKGTTTRQDEEMLQEKGIEFIKIPVPKFNS
jgi:hypothetical protein